jgi:hypothetical protein
MSFFSDAGRSLSNTRDAGNELKVVEEDANFCERFSQKRCLYLLMIVLDSAIEDITLLRNAPEVDFTRITKGTREHEQRINGVRVYSNLANRAVSVRPRQTGSKSGSQGRRPNGQW